MFCKNCGKEIPEDAKFCPNCGAKQNGEEETLLKNHVGLNEVECNMDFEDNKPRKSSVIAYLGFGLSIASIFVDYEYLVSIIAFGLSIAGICDCNNNHKKGKGLAKAGIFISIIKFILVCIGAYVILNSYY